MFRSNSRAQVSLETMSGMVVFLIFFIGVFYFTSTQAQAIQASTDQVNDKVICDSIAQAIYSAKYSSLDWNGVIDRNFRLANDTIYVNYYASQSFNGIFCKTLQTNLDRNLNVGNLWISYDGNFIFINN